MGNEQGVEDLFFDLASQSRLGILYELRRGNLKMNELARRVDLTATETYRQLQRLSEARLVAKQPEGDYALTEYCKLVLQLSPALEFVFKHQDYFLSRAIWRVPYEFLNRLGELSSGTLVTNVADSLNNTERIIKEAKEHVWTIGDKSLDSIAPLMLERYNSGIRSFRFMIAENLLLPNRPSQGHPGVEERTLPQIPAMVVCTEKEAAVCLLVADGRADYAGFFGADPMFRKWVNDLFVHFWTMGKRVS